MERNRQNRRSTTVQVDGNALIAELQKRNLKPVDASIEMGFSPQYINNMLSDARRCNRDNVVHISKAAVNLLFEKFNIRPDSILYVEPEPVVETPPQEGATFTLNENTLYRVIYAAVYAAVKQAWSE